MYVRCLGVFFLLFCLLDAATAVVTPTYVSVKSIAPLSLSSLFRPKTAINFSGTTPSVSYTFSGTVPDAINYVQLCNAGSDTSCASCNAPFANITTGTPIPYNTHSISAEAIAEYLSSNAFAGSVATPITYNIGMYVQSEHFYCNSNSAYCSTSVDNNVTTPHKLCMQATYDGTNVTALTRSDNGNARLSTSTPQIAYVGTSGGSLYYCTLNTDGEFTSCNTTSPTSISSWTPYGETFTSVNNTQYAYIADSNGVGGIGHMYVCTIDSNGSLNACNSTPAAVPSWNPQRVTFATVNGTQYGYVSDVNGHIDQCTLNSDGSLNVCTSVANVSGSVRGITFATVDGTQYAYVAGYSSGVVDYCAVNSDGTLSCNPTSPSGITAWTPTGIAVATVNGTQYAYVADSSGSGNVYYCTLTSGAFDVCNPALSSPPGGVSSSWSPYAIKIQTIGSTQYAYVADNANHVYQCQFDLTTGGAFTGCTATPTTTPAEGWAPNDIAFATVDSTQYAYVASSVGNHIYRCSLSGALFSGCSNVFTSDEPAWLTRGITFATASNGTHYAYVASTGGSGGRNMYQCVLNNDGSFASCSVTPSVPSWSPYAVVMGTVHGVQYAYVADNSGSLYQCQLSSTDGSFHNCITTADTTHVGFWTPNDLTFATITGTQYVYIASANPNHIYRCSFNTNGTVNVCGNAYAGTAAEQTWLTRGIDVANVNGTSYAYVASTGSNGSTGGRHVYYCTFNTTGGTFDSCSSALTAGEPSSWNPQRVRISTVHGTQYAYVADVNNNKVYRCSVNTSTGAFNNDCEAVPTASAPSWNPRGIALPSLFAN